MARFGIYRNEGKSKKVVPCLIDVQSNVIGGLATRIVVPLRSPDAFGKVSLPKDLCPVIAIKGEVYFLDTPQLPSIPSSELKKKISSAVEYRPQIFAALDRVFGAH